MASRSDRRRAISIHALREESDADALHLGLGEVISIHALREESDCAYASHCHRSPLFQSTLSVRRATTTTASNETTAPISIHALREESDPVSLRTDSQPIYFNPRSP